MNFVKKNILSLFFVIILLTSGIIRFWQSNNFDFPLTYDQGRDLIDIRVLANFYDFKISGPTTSITGLNLGPFYYLFNLPAYWLGVGNPQYLVAWNILWFLFSGAVIYAFFWKRDKLLGFYISTIFLMSPQLFSVTRYFWNANSVVYFIVFYFLVLWNYIENKSSRNAIILGVAAGLVVQFEAAFGSYAIVFSLTTILVSRNLLKTRNYLMGLLPWFIPQVVYEISHNFQMLKLFWGALIGSHSILGVQIPFNKIIFVHLKTLTTFFEGQFMLPYGVGLVLIIFSVIVIYYLKLYKNYANYFLAFFVGALIYFSIIYRHELKPWYLEGVRVIYCFVVGIALTNLKKLGKVALLLTSLFLIRSFYLTVIDQNSYVTDNAKSNDPKNAANIITNINWVYGKAGGDGFEAYNYVPEVYDFSTNYLYWWYGNKNYGYIPSKISYSLSEVPEYIRKAGKFQNNTRINNENNIALIYEAQGNYGEWLKQFKDYCLMDQKIFDWKTTVEWRQKCK